MHETQQEPKQADKAFKRKLTTPPELSKEILGKPPKLSCMNCELNYMGFYCPRCGQPARTRRLSLRNMFADSILHSMDLEHGLLHTLKDLMLRPGSAIREYIHGRRVNLYIPIRFLVLVGAIATLISLRYDLFIIDHDNATEQVGDLFPWFGETFSHWYDLHFGAFWAFANEYTTVINIVSIPIFSLCSHLMFLHQGYNYAENLILNTYIVCMQLSLLVAFALPLEIFSTAKAEIIFAYTLMTIAYNIWCYMCFFCCPPLNGFFRSAAANILAYIAQFITVHALYYFTVEGLGMLAPSAS